MMAGWPHAHRVRRADSHVFCSEAPEGGHHRKVRVVVYRGPLGTAPVPAPAVDAHAPAVHTWHPRKTKTALAGREEAPVAEHGIPVFECSARSGRVPRMAVLATGSGVGCIRMQLGLHAHGRRKVDGTSIKAPIRFMGNLWAIARWRCVDSAV